MRTRWARASAVALGIAIACTSAPTPPEAGPTVSPGTPTPTPSPSPSPTVQQPAELVVAVKGDWGAGTEAQRRVTARMCAVRERRPFRFVLTTGDNFYAPDGVATRDNYRRPERCLRTADGHRWRATWGNHDAAGSSTGDVLGAEHWYAWRAGDVEFFALDSNEVGSNEQRAWLVRALRDSDARIKIAYFHHPPFTASNVHDPHVGVRSTWVPLFERHGVSLVLTGHSHAYEHHRHAGIDYVVTGGGGRSLYGCSGDPRSLRRCEAAYHFTLLRIRQDRIIVRAILPSGKTLDRFTIEV